MNPGAVIEAKRDGRTLSEAELQGFVHGFVEGKVASYQMSAFLMAVYFRGMSPEETAALTRIMAGSGDTLTFSGIPGLKVDKHSTGGVGDLVSLPLAPLVAACGVPVPMISGRGLGHTGGTLDKLESIPGLRTDLDAAEMQEILGKTGFAMGGQTGSLAPADKLMYALRDVTATVESIPLIVSSILSKKVAAGIDALVLDVKFGRGAFMKSEADASTLAGELVRVGEAMGKRVVAFLTDMDLPLGNTVGNGLEMQSALECLRGRGPEDVMDLVGVLGTAMLGLGKPGTGWQDNQAALESALARGEGLARFRAMAVAQGGDPAVIDGPGTLPTAPVETAVLSDRVGFVTDLEPRALGEAVVELGGGRRRAEDPVDYTVGVRLEKVYGDPVREGETMATVYSRTPEAGQKVVRDLVAPAYTVGPGAPPVRKRIRRIITRAGSVEWKGRESWPVDRETEMRGHPQ